MIIYELVIHFQEGSKYLTLYLRVQNEQGPHLKSKEERKYVQLQGIIILFQSWFF